VAGWTAGDGLVKTGKESLSRELFEDLVSMGGFGKLRRKAFNIELPGLHG